MLKKFTAFMLILAMATAAVAGGAACVVIINCGALKAKAAELEVYAASATVLRAHAAELAALEGEICDLGPEIAEYLSPAERDELNRRAAQAWELGGTLQKYMDAWDSKSPKDHAQLARDLQAFMDDQAEWFHGLAAKYKDR